MRLAPARLNRARTGFSLQFACFYAARSLQHARTRATDRHRIADGGKVCCFFDACRRHYG